MEEGDEYDYTMEGNGDEKMILVKGNRTVLEVLCSRDPRDDPAKIERKKNCKIGAAGTTSSTQ